MAQEGSYKEQWALGGLIWGSSGLKGGSKGFNGGSRGLKGTHWISREALVEVMEGKKLGKRGKEGKFYKWPEEKKKRENIEALYERLIIKSVMKVGFPCMTPA